ncbi:MAG: N-acetylmuramoyl-L-alanine amidase [Syntrophomonadaceae bacterium]|nr:N-acetylmuramoyl-L-alanine amidase [Syntrophomonadaceae bacterium]
MKETNLRFTNNLRLRNNTRRIVLHHTATDYDVSAATVHNWHINQGWSGIGYHYLIRLDGSIERGRTENTIGAHAGSEGNGDSIGIALVGNFEKTAPNANQIDALIKLIMDIESRYGVLSIVEHKDIVNTACPGRRFPLEEVIKRVEEARKKMVEPWKRDLMNQAKTLGLITSDHDPDEPATKWFVLAVAINLLKIVGRIK